MPKKSKKPRLSKTDTAIAIIGTGPASLSTALSLQKAGFASITIYERDAHFTARKDGYGLTLTYNPSEASSNSSSSANIQAPLSLLGILEELARRDCPSRAHYVFDSTGKILGYYGNSFRKGHGYGQRGNLRIPRQMLRKVMLNALLERDNGEEKKVKIVWGKKLSSYKYDNMKESPHRPITLRFADGSTETADLLVGADGVRSTVIKQLLYSDTEKEAAKIKTYNTHGIQMEESSSNKSLLNYTGIMIILGITSDFYHPLLDERGFYTLDGKHRLFTMPFEGSKIDDLEKYDIPLNDTSMGKKRTRRYMWQLSYHLDSIEEAIELSKVGAIGLLKDVLNRTEGWHDPVQAMIRSTPMETIWGTPLMDRDPNDVLKHWNQVYNKRQGEVIRTAVMGDAIHSMSPFKGQGCNQSLMDGPLLCHWLEKSNLDSAMKGFMREMVQRTRKKVIASRQAASYLHSKEVLESSKESFAGVADDDVQTLVQLLEEKGINANLSDKLDDSIQKIIIEYNLDDDDKKDEYSDSESNDTLEANALAYTEKGSLSELRKLSLNTSGVHAIKKARDVKLNTCLHIAAKIGCYHTTRWLISEMGMEVNTQNLEGYTSYEISKQSGKNKRLTLLLEKLSKLDKQ